MASIKKCCSEPLLHHCSINTPPLSPSPFSEDRAASLKSFARLNHRRNGKHDIYSGINGKDVLSLFMKFKKTDIFNTKFNFIESEYIINNYCDKKEQYSDKILNSSSLDKEEDNCDDKKCSPVEVNSADGSSPRLHLRRNGLCYSYNDVILTALGDRNKKKFLNHIRRRWKSSDYY